MPTERFVKLKGEKKEVISRAVIGEFQRTPYRELKIAKIARSARVSRGSLYTYFLDKEDMFVFALNQTWKSLLERNKENLLKANGDFWPVMEAALHHQLEICKTNQICRLLYLASESSSNSYEVIFREYKEKEFQKYKDWMYDHMAKRNFRIKTREEFDVLQETCQSLLVVAVLGSLYDTDFELKVEADFKQKLQQMKKYLQ